MLIHSPCSVLAPVITLPPGSLFAGEHFCGYCADVWALGLTLYVFIFGVVPFGHDDSNATELFDRIQKHECVVVAGLCVCFVRS